MRPEKVWMAQKLKTIAQSQPAIIMTDFTGLSCAAIAGLRSRLKEISASYVVVKDRLLSRVVKEANGIDIDKLSQGPTGLAFGADPVSVARILREFSSTNENLKIKGGLLKDRTMDKNQILELAKIPPAPVLIAQIIGMLKQPMAGLVYVLQANISGLVTVLSRIKEQKEEAAPKSS